MLAREEVLRRFDTLRQAVVAGGRRAPHKPLLALFLMGKLQHRGADTTPLTVAYTEADTCVSPLIAEFGPEAREKHRAAMPFFHLDRTIWHLERTGLDARHSCLRDAEAVGALDPDVQAALQQDPTLLVAVARRLLEANFPESYFAALCAATGLQLEVDVHTTASSPEAKRPRPRSADFRRAVLRAYGGRCAFCGFDGEVWSGGLTKVPVGVDGHRRKRHFR